MVGIFNMHHLLLAFPTVVVLLATAAFAFGGRCALWQWWLAALITVAIGFWRRPVREGMRTGLVFLAWLAVVWVGCGLAIAPNWFDESVYHIPAVRMLADGWNPLYVRTPESLLQFAGLEAGDCRIDHIVFLPKIVWVFDAVAFHFTGELLNPMIPIMWFLLPAVVLHVWCAMEGSHVIWKLLAVPLLYCLLSNSAYLIDAVVALAAIGLFLSFEEVLSARRTDVISLAAYSFWMMGAKTNGLVHGGLFWGIFLVFVFWRKTFTRKLYVVVGAVAVMLMVACASPFLTSLLDYGHPLYPQYTFDQKRFPRREMAWEFATCQNADAAQMGYVGRYVNAFVSPLLARAWYRWWLDKPAFSQESAVWRHYPTDGDGSSPTRCGVRIAFWVSTLLLLFAARKPFRPIALMVLVGICSVPPLMLGYIRYIPWWLAPILLLYIDSVSRHRRSWQTFAVVLLAGTFALRPYTLVKRIEYAAVLVDERRQLLELLGQDGALGPMRPCMRASLGELKLVRRHLPLLQKAELLPYSKRREREFRRAHLEVPGKLFFFDEEAKMRQYAFTIKERTSMGFLLRVCTRMLPLAIVERIGSIFGKRNKKVAPHVQ